MKTWDTTCYEKNAVDYLRRFDYETSLKLMIDFREYFSRIVFPNELPTKEFKTPIIADLKEITSKYGMKFGDAMQILRVCTTGKLNGLDMIDSIWILGVKRNAQRILYTFVYVWPTSDID